ncbi:MAG: protease complex subunit PrcB family protein [Bacteroidota bacterium]
MPKDSTILLAVVVLLAAVPIAACQAPPDAPEPEHESLDFERVGHGRNSSIQAPTEVRITDPQMWRQYADSLSPIGSLSEVDFDERDILLIAVPVNSGGYDLAVDEVERVDGDVRVHYTLEEPGEDCLTAQVLLTPFVAVSVPGLETDPIFERSVVTYSCGVRQN